MTTFRVSPPARKQIPQKSEHFEECVPRLILAPFSPQAEVKFGEVAINSMQWKTLVIFNPSISMTIQFTNINADDRISLSENKIQLNSREEKQVIVSWCPVRSGYLRKVIRAQCCLKKAKSFDVILSGMAVNKGVQNSKKRKLKSEINATGMSGNYSNAAVTSTQTSNEKSRDFRRETFSIEEKENRLPIHLNHKKPVIKSSSPSSEYPLLTVLNENSLLTNFSRFSSYDSVDAPTKYSNFESEFNANRHNFVNGNLSDEMDLRGSTFSMDVENHPFEPPKSSFSDSLGQEERSSTPTKNETFQMNDVDIQMTPLKKLDELADSLLLSPHDNRPTFTKSESDISSIEVSGFSNFSFKPSSKDGAGVLFISPPGKATKSNRRSSDFVHRLESSAIKDRRKYLRTNFASKKKMSPKKLTSSGCRSTTFNVSTVEKIKSQNPHVLKQMVTSQCHIEDPFIQQLLYTNDQWVEEQEEDIIKWMNLILVPSTTLNEEQTDRSVDGAEAWINRNYSSDSVLVSKKIPITMRNAPEELNILRKRKEALMQDDYVKVVFNELSTQVNKKIIFVREGRDIYADEGIKKKLLQLLACYNPVWLRMGLEAVYKQEITLSSKSDFGGLGWFIRKNVIVTSSLAKKTEREKEAIRKNILLKFLQLIFFMDRARINKLIRHNRCLFTLDSKHKSSQSLLAEFCADLVTGRRDIKKQLKDIGYEMLFKQTCIDEYDYTIRSLKDLNDGVRLTRLFEILFSEPTLCTKLRVPAIDIENKKFNIEVAMAAVKARCTIKGNITAEDFVLVTRHGSRLKILSFLWQVIYNYLTPLYEKSAIKIQRWWKSRRERVKAARLCSLQRMNASAKIIQAAWRKYFLRKNLNQWVHRLRVQRQKEEDSARIIQTRFRAFLEMKRDLEAYRRKVEGVKTIQRWFRCKRLRVRFLDLKNATILIQRRFRAREMMTACRTNFLELKRNTVIIQRRFRANKAMIAQRTQFLNLKNACMIVQQRCRALLVMKKERESFIQLKQSVILIQRTYRANVEMKKRRNNFLQLKASTLKIQTWYRSYVEMKKYRDRFLQVKAATLKIQAWYVAWQKMKTTRSQYLHLRTIVVRIQREFRSKQLMRNERQQYMRLKWATVEVQRQYRAKKAMQVERERYLNLKWAVLVIQRRFRASRSTLARRNGFLRLKDATLAIQRRYRATILMREERSRFLILKTIAIKIQRKYRATVLMRKQRAEYENVKNSAIMIQRTYRSFQLMRTERGRFLKLKKAAISVQQAYRALKSMKQARESFVAMKKSAIVLQSYWRMKMARDDFVRMKEASIKIQRCWLRIQAKKRQQRQQPVRVQSVEERAAVKIQAIWRGYRTRKNTVIPTRRKSSDSRLSQPTLGQRYRKAIDQIKTSDIYAVIFNGLWNLERVTTFSPKLCEGVTREGIVPIVFNLMSRGNRSEPSMELYRSGISILINLALYRPTKAELWNNMNKEEDLALIIHLMKFTHDKFSGGAFSRDVFRYGTTFLWLLCQEKPIAKFIAKLPFRTHLEKMKLSLDSKCVCRKTTKNKRVTRMLPKTETNWYADVKTRTFDDNCFAIFNLCKVLYGSR